jgi:hypothetical protein
METEAGAAVAAANETAAPSPTAGSDIEDRAGIDVPADKLKLDHWVSLPHDLQSYIAKRESDAQQEIARAAEQVRELQQKAAANEPLRQLIDAHATTFRARGLAPAQAVAALLEAQRQLDAESPLLSP